ncbi:MAG: 2-hydroxyacyl-CoA dehydratase [Clostridiales bacterium]|nr:2-hydroxyacyl-CoA dehydratase [Clostridiales bacterium]
MAELVYNKDGRLLFTKEMKKEYTILMPQMLPIHFEMFRQLLLLEGYKVDQLNNDSRNVVDEGLKYVHNDTCYPALLVIGQFMDAIKNGGYDPHKIALFITQTGGGCRASNYIHLLRKALKKAGMEYIPVISVSFGLESNPGFSLTVPLLQKLVFGMMYGDLIMNVSNQVRPYEQNMGDTDAAVQRWISELVSRFQQGKGMSRKAMCQIFDEIIADFEAIPVDLSHEKVRVGVVGEIYVKFSALGNNHLEEFLLSEGTEPVVPGLTDFMIFKIYNRVVDVDIYGGNPAKKALCQFMMDYVQNCQHDMIHALEKSRFRAPGDFEQLRQLVQGYLGEGCKMGEGWLLTAEMLELIHSGTNNIVCTQPFGCLPNHIVGKGMIRALKDNYPNSNVVAIDYDPSATKINQENRIKLMLANAKALAARADEEKAAREKAPV